MRAEEEMNQTIERIVKLIDEMNQQSWTKKLRIMNAMNVIQ